MPVNPSIERFESESLAMSNPGPNSSERVNGRDSELAPYAMRSDGSAGREHAEPPHPYRSPFQRDRDRVLHTAAFRRLSDKTQVFTGDMGDYHRTRLTHTMEVASIARTVGRNLRLNEDLIEALAMLHDVGHPPFGHAGEDALNQALQRDGGFSHNQFALNLVQYLECPYPAWSGLNLTHEVLACQQARVLKSRATERPLLEAQVVDAADSLAYNAHDLDDALKLGLITLEQATEVPLVASCVARSRERFGELDVYMTRRTLVAELIDRQVSDVLRNSQRMIHASVKTLADVPSAPVCVGPSAELLEQKQQLQDFLFQQVYRHPDLTRVRAESQQKLLRMFDHYCGSPEELPAWFQRRIESIGVRRTVGDYLGGMTDRYCLQRAEQIWG